MQKIYDMAVKTGSYESNGETKGRYENIGSVMQGDNGMFVIMKRTFNPAGVANPENKDSLIVSFFEPKPANQQNNQQQGQQNGGYQQQNQQQQQNGQQQNNGYQNQQNPSY